MLGRSWLSFGLLGLVMAGAALADGPAELKIHHLDIEQGDATLIVSPDGHALLFDGGNRGMGTGRIIPRLRSLGITSLDYTVASHYDADHISGLAEVIKGGYQPIVAYDRGASQKTTDTYASYVAAAGARRRTILPGEMLHLGAEVVIECVAVNGMTADGQRAPASDDENASSVALVVRYRGFEEFIAGDLTAGGLGTVDVESLLGPRVRDLDVYRVCHHGSETGTSAAFLARTLPEVAVISCGTANDFGHPARGALDRLTQAPSVGTIWCTNRGSEATSPKLRVVSSTYGNDGEITITTSGAGTYSVNEVVYPLVVDTTPASITSGPAAETARPAPTILWTTSEPAEAVVEYGLTASYGSTARRTTLDTSHALGLPGLAATTTYHYRVGAIDSTGNASWSQDGTLTTSAAATWRGVVINEVASNGSGSSEWVELRNGATSAVDMTGWVLGDGEGHEFRLPALTLPVGARVVVTSAASGADDPDASDGLATFPAGRAGRFGATSVWNDAGDDVLLKDAAGNPVDFLAFGSGTAIQPAPPGEWSGAFLPRPASGSGLGLSRFPDGGADSATGADWALRALTQGSTNGIPPAPPTAVAGASLALREGDTATFDGSASTAMTGATIVSYLWSFGDGASAVGARVTHPYADDGEFQAVLTVTDSNGLRSIAGRAVQVSNVAPSVTVPATYAAMQGVLVPLSGSATDAASDAPTLSFAWDFGDGSSASGASVAHVYTGTGTFTATLFASDKDGDRGAATTQVTVVTPSAPYIGALSPTSGTQGGGTLVTITGYRLGGAAVTFGAQQATVVSVSVAATPTASQTLLCLTPPGIGLGLVDVRVTTAGGRYTRSRVYGYSDPAPAITSVSPGAAPTGAATPVTITGTGFFQAGSVMPTVVVGGRAATVSTVGPTGIACVVQDDLAGLKDVVVTTPDGRTATLASGFERRSGPRLEVSTPQGAVAGYPLPPLQVRVADASGATITTATNTITIGLDANPAGATLSGPVVATASNGVATFDGLSLDRPGGGVTIRAVSSLLSGECAAFEVRGGPAALVFQSQPRTVELSSAGIPRQPPITIEVQDASGRVVSGVPISVTIAASGGATLAGQSTRSTGTGSVTFDDLSVARAGADYVLTARAGALTATSALFDVLPGPARRLVFLTSPGNGTSGIALDPAPVVGAQDLSGNAIVTTATITLSVPRTSPRGALYGVWAADGTGRSATFSDLRITAAGGYTLIASAPGFASATSRPFSIAPGPAARLAFRGQPTLSEPGLPIWPPVRVVVQDAGGNDVAAAAGDVTITLGSDPGGALLSGATTAPVVTGGVAVFPGLTLDRAGFEYDLVASAGGLASATSSPFDIEASLFRFKAATPAVSDVTVGAVAIGDLDGDGLGDVVTTLPEENAISIRRSTGAARFGPEDRVPVGRDPAGVVIADLNDDGWPDVAVADRGTSDVAVLLGTGGGALSSPRYLSVGRPVTSLAAGDIDCDGRVDLVGSSGDTEVLVLFQTSVGTLTLPQAVPAASGRIRSFALADMDRDGALDLVVAQQPSGVLITYGDGRGGFSGTTALPAGDTILGVAASDQTRDGFPEVVLLRDDVSLDSEHRAVLMTYANRRNRTFAAAVPSPGTPRGTGLALADVNGDGIPDALVTGATFVFHGLSLLPGKTTGAFFGAPVQTETRTIPAAVTTGDVNGDGLPDVALSFSFATSYPSFPAPRAVDVALAVGDGSFGLAQQIYWPEGEPRHMTSGDMTGDGRLEVISACPGNGNMPILIARPDDTFKGSSGIHNSGIALSHPAVGSVLVDFNGDGKADLATAAQNPGSVHVWRATGGQWYQGYMVVHPIAGTPEAIASGDLNGDGRQDLVVSDSTGKVWVLLGRTGAAFDPARSFPAGAGASKLALADVTGDGRLDAVVVTSVGVECLAGTGAGGLSAPSQIMAQTGVVALCAGSLNGDGLQDLVVVLPGSAVVLYATGQGLFQYASQVALGSPPRSAVLRDLDRDGIPELILANGASHDLSIHPGRRGQPFGPPRRFPTGLDCSALTVADLTGDGIGDIVTEGPSSWTVLLGR